MSKRHRPSIPRLTAIAAVLGLGAGGLGAAMLGAPSPAAASARMFSPDGIQMVNVSVSFSSEVPLPDLSQATIAQTQAEGRRFLYRLGRAECAVLKDVIAKTCRLTNLNVSAQIRTHNTAQPPRLYINGSATFTIGLKDQTAAVKK